MITPLLSFREVEMKDNASELYAELEIIPNVFRKKYERFKTGHAPEEKVSQLNVDFVLLLHYLEEVRVNRSVEDDTIRDIVRGYCGPMVCREKSLHPVAPHAKRLLNGKRVEFKLCSADAG